MADRKSTSLVLGSGGARGLTQIGVIRCLEEHDYDIRYIAGSSIGALIGGIYATGELETYADWVSALRKSDIVRLLDWSFDGSSIFKGEKIIRVLKDLVGDCDIEDLPIGYTAVATDLAERSSQREVWLNRGPLFDAIRASMAVPTIFAPVQSGNRLLADGGIVNPVPVAPTLNDHTEVTIAVDLNGANLGRAVLDEADEPEEPSALVQAYRQGIGRFLDMLSPGEDEHPRLGFSDLATRAMEVMQGTITQFKLAATAPTAIVQVPRDLCSFFDFHRAEALIEFGYERASEAIDALEGAPDELDDPP